MLRRSNEVQERDLDQIVEAYESAIARNAGAELEEFLPSAGHPNYVSILCELVRIDLEHGWRQGQARPLEEYGERFPALLSDRSLLRDVAFEEWRLRLQAGERPNPLEYESRFGIDCTNWPQPPERSVDSESSVGSRLGPSGCSIGSSSALTWRREREGANSSGASLASSEPLQNRASRLARLAARLPHVGEDFLGFRLVGELGQGAFGRVYLARQGDLADRCVALKISTDLATESQTLAQLQHTNVVPIHSIHRSGPFQAVCMPYLGPTTLADILKSLKSQGSLPDSGKALVSSLIERSSRITVGSDSEPAAGSAPASAMEAPAAPRTLRSTAVIETLNHLGYVDAVLWMAERLADGLAHAHERGILHRDLKPANILVTDEGEPMLLDFNLAADTKDPEAAAAAQVGGTLPYMAPEHLEALQGGARPVDERSDLFALGVILFELLTGRHPFPIRQGSLSGLLRDMVGDRLGPVPAVRRWNQEVTPAVESIVQHLLEADPDRRYQSARELLTDLRRQQNHERLRFARDPSPRERARKWVRRHPRLTSSTTLVTAAAVLIVAFGFAWVARERRLDRLEAYQSLRLVEENRRSIHHLLSGSASEPAQVEEGIGLCRQTIGKYRLLESPSWRGEGLARSLDPVDRMQLQSALGEMLFSWARALSWKAKATPPGPERTEHLRTALDLNARIERCLGSGRLPRAVLLQRAQLARLDGRDADAERLEREAAKIPVGDARDSFLSVLDQIDQHRFREVVEFLHEASRSQTQDYATWLVLGDCYVGLKRPDAALAHYEIGIALRPNAPWAYYHRGLLHLERKAYTEAIHDFDRVIELRPRVAEGYANRALAKLGLDDAAGAVADFTRALDLSSSLTRLYFMRARARQQAGDNQGARQDREEGLRRQPSDESSWVARGLARLPGDPQAALADFEAALRLNPQSTPALQNKAAVLSEALGRTQDAVQALDRLLASEPGSVPARAGRGVLLARLGRRDAALSDAREALKADRSSEVLYQVAGIYALTSKQSPGDAGEAMGLLTAALRRDNRWLRVVRTDRDFDPLRHRPEFQTLLQTVAALDRVSQAGL